MAPLILKMEVKMGGLWKIIKEIKEKKKNRKIAVQVRHRWARTDTTQKKNSPCDRKSD